MLDMQELGWEVKGWGGDQTLTQRCCRRFCSSRLRTPCSQNSKWNPTRGPQLALCTHRVRASTAILCPLCLVWIFVYSEIPVLPPDPPSGWNPSLTSHPLIQQHPLSQGFFFFLTPALLPPLTCLAWVVRRCTFTFTFKSELQAAGQRSRRLTGRHEREKKV